MAKQLLGLVANLDLCIGCFACQVACKQEHQLPEGTDGIQITTIGPYQHNGELAMDFVPLCTDACDLCAARRAAGERPFCAQICPTQALALRGDDEILSVLREDKIRFQLSKLIETT